MERAIKMQHSDKGIMSIGPSSIKWEQILSDRIFSGHGETDFFSDSDSGSESNKKSR
jgi:hypothetical protein